MVAKYEYEVKCDCEQLNFVYFFELKLKGNNPLMFFVSTVLIKKERFAEYMHSLFIASPRILFIS